MADSIASTRIAADQRAAFADTPPGAPRPCPDPALPAQRHYVSHQGQQVAMYLSMPRADAGNAQLRPLVLVHSINAAASAAEVRPVFEHYRNERPVLALELPGFGSSDRRRIDYTPRLMSGCILRAADYLQELGFREAPDLMAVSLSCEIAALAALKRPSAFATLGFVSPTGFESKRPERYEQGLTKDKPWLRWLLEAGPWANPLFRLLTSEKSMRTFLERTWGSKAIDEGLLAYNLVSVKQPGARHAPYAFIGGSLFTRGIVHRYAALEQPVWMVHGRRGEFAKVDGLAHFAPAGQWQIEAADTGAMPYFEQPAAFIASYEAFLGRSKIGWLGTQRAR